MDTGVFFNRCRILILSALGMFLAAMVVGAFGIYGGYNVAADEPHSAVVLWLANTTRMHSIASHAQGIALPISFVSDQQVRAGAAEYAEMCSSCHLAPGGDRSEISLGLYPRAPELMKGSSLTPGEEFWVIKHGIKMTGMPAWGATHSDKIIWSIVAFLQKLPSLSPEQYKALTKDAAEEHDEMKDMSGSKH
jgi:mono/diheme cytochrome c family protein